MARDKDLEIIDIIAQVKDSSVRQLLQKLYTIVEVEFNTMPASVKYHHVKPGDLGRHVKEVMSIALEIFDLHPDWYGCSRDDVIVAAFVHDFNKLGRYVDSEDWQKQPKYGGVMFQVNKSKMFLSEAAETVMYCAMAGLIMTPLQVNAVSLHHGGWAEGGKAHGGMMSPLAILLHSADMISGFVLGK